MQKYGFISKPQYFYMTFFGSKVFFMLFSE